MVRPKKHLGQHFLTDNNIAQKIVDCLDSNFSNVCEIGPGMGVLTTPLLNKEYIKELKLIEIDAESIEHLNNNFTDDRLSIINADFLRINIDSIFTTPFAVIGNFPFNISSQIFFKVLENRNSIPLVVGMIQKEVAERIAAPHGNRTYGIMSVLLQSWYDIEYCFTVNENVFFPPPKVKSAVIRLKRNLNEKLDCDEKLFFTTVKTAFNHRRKTLRNALKPLLPNIQQSDHKFFSLRAEQLSPVQFVELTQVVENLSK
ncbi:MAG: 16S rRNA (adenine(1518)-N(6)/adenine(1519)-N(6))-dimethyltransferase RsmA [Bacteroidetes bacterium]|nr:16S rRNA (adenine(1518)-N(6)/adenine(1519)-N(6))-dimethyltransferase RsmA [Bacteroidota bacterium]MBL6943848.1 16S rRNA (adenine(1518)-N(6)/adenine(1519)-N(6))-dimethyltransferase RsmA [Bacteroidales bacterium]